MVDDGSSDNAFDIGVIGIGAMGGSMARALMRSSISKTVSAFDQADALLEAFFNESKASNKHATEHVPKTLKEVVGDRDIVVLVLQNEPQCDTVCFTSPDGDNLATSMKRGSCVILCSTVTAVWAKRAAEKFQERGILFVDCPVSGGPARALKGDLSMMASGDESSLGYARPALDAMGSQVHIIAGGAGMGSTAKMVHQLLAGVHIVAAAEALALAAKAGLDVQQIFNIVNGAAGASWMFNDRGQRMLQGSETFEVKSQCALFLKDLDIVHHEAKRLASPTPLASAALQQFTSAAGLGLTQQDDSQVVQVYEKLNGASVALKGVNREGNNVGEFWKMEDGSLEEIVEVGMEPRHFLCISNEYVRALRVTFPPNDTTLAHRHAEDSLYFFLVKGGLEVVNHVQGSTPACDCMEFGEVRFGTHKTDKPLVHKITNKTNQIMLCIDAEVLKSPPITSPIPLVAEKHELIKTRNKCRVYKLKLEPKESVTVSYPFFFFSVIVEGGTIETEVDNGSVKWTETFQTGDVAWKEPVLNLQKTNTGTSTYVEYISEWR